MRRLFFLLLVTVVVLILVGDLYANSLTVFQGRILLASFNGEYKELFRTESPFYGYGWIDKEEVLLAYQPDGEAEAFAVVEVFNLPSGKKVKIAEISGAGESHFAVHPRRREVVFNDSKGIQVLNIEKNGTYKITKITHDTSAFAPFWIDDNTIGYLRVTNKGSKFMKVVLRR